MKRLALALAFLAAAAHAQDASVTAVPLQAEQLPAVSTTQPPPPFTVPGVVVTLADGLGFSRDAALTQAARQALPVVLGQLKTPIAQARANDIAKTVGEPMQFVKSYKIVKEVLVPKYTLTVDLVYDAAKLQTNFGKTETTVSAASATVSHTVAYKNVNGVVTAVTETAVAEAVAATAPDLPQPGQTVHVSAATAAGQDKIFSALAKAGLSPVWKIIRRDGGDLAVTTDLTPDQLADKLHGLGLDARADTGAVTLTAE